MKKIYTLIGILIFLCALGYWAYPFIQGVLPVLKPAPQDITQLIPKEGQDTGENETNIPLTLPEDFRITIYADNVPNARVMGFDEQANMYVSQTKSGTISLVTKEGDTITGASPILQNLESPHGLVFDYANPGMMYYTTETAVYRLRVPSSAPPEKILDLPEGGRHTTRTLHFGSDGRLYISIGSTCDVCYEEHPWVGTIIVTDREGNTPEVYAKGLRNAVFMTTNYVTGDLWATEMGRDRLGDDLPPDEINVIREGNNYGWPVCYGQNIHDTDFDKNTYIRNPCQEPTETPAEIDLPAHSAPLGLAFIPEEGWPEDYWYDLLVAYHGSWNRTEPTGYKIVRHKFDAQGNYEGVEDFITGWLTPDGALGRPVDIIAQPGGILYISDDKAGVIYKVVYTKEVTY